jgi:hypothetical protein
MNGTFYDVINNISARLELQFIEHTENDQEAV